MLSAFLRRRLSPVWPGAVRRISGDFDAADSGRLAAAGWGIPPLLIGVLPDMTASCRCCLRAAFRHLGLVVMGGAGHCYYGERVGWQARSGLKVSAFRPTIISCCPALFLTFMMLPSGGESCGGWRIPFPPSARRWLWSAPPHAWKPAETRQGHGQHEVRLADCRSLFAPGTAADPARRPGDGGVARAGSISHGCSAELWGGQPRLQPRGVFGLL